MYMCLHTYTYIHTYMQTYFEPLPTKISQLNQHPQPYKKKGHRQQQPQITLKYTPHTLSQEVIP